MIDLHCHLLPGVDDGAKTIEDSVAMARMAAAAGTKTIVATPHMLHPQFHVPGPLAREKFAEVKRALAEANVPVQVALGGEIHWAEDIPARLDAGELLPLCDGTGAGRRYILFELPYTHVPDPFREVCWRFQMAGIFPVLAHPERISELQDRPELLEPIHDAGILVQVTAMSLTGDFGRRSRKTAERWLRDGLVDVIASDGHSCRSRPPVMDAAARLARKAGGETCEDWVTREAPRRVLAGEPVLG